MTPLVAFIGPIGFSEMIIIGIIALLLYGGDLPKVAKSWGKTYQELRRHLTGIQRDLNSAIYADDDEAPPKLQYYPEFRDEHLNETSDAVVVDSPVEHYSPVAEAAMHAEEAAQIAAADSSPSEGDDEKRQDHGAA